MSEQRLMQLLLAPVVSEKSTRVGDQNNQYVFRVATDAAKPEIARAVELMFSVKVERVTVANVKGKRKGQGQRRGHRSDWRKAYVTLAPGQEIDFMPKA